MFIHSVVKISSTHNKNLVSQLGSQTDLCACNRNVLHYAITRNKWLKKNELKCFLSYRIFLHCTTGYFLYTSRDKRYFFRAKHAQKKPNFQKSSILSHTGGKNYMHGYVLEALYHNCENHGPWVRVHTLERGQCCYIVKMY